MDPRENFLCTLVQCNNKECIHNNKELYENGGFCLLEDIQIEEGKCISIKEE